MTQPPRTTKKNLHPRNCHNHGYDFEKLVQVCPPLKSELTQTPAGTTSINFASPQAVRLLNEALLKSEYGVRFWQLDERFLCPPIPGRVDYLHYLADLLASTYQTTVNKLKQRTIRGLDIGCGASLIYPLLGQQVYGWRFVGSDINTSSIKASQQLIKANGLISKIEVREQSRSQFIFNHIIQKNEFYDFTMCNPPFHRSAAEAANGSQRKQQNLANNKFKRNGQSNQPTTALNFSGRSNELWCDGGEVAFIGKMIDESKAFC